MILEHHSETSGPIDLTLLREGCRRLDKPTGLWASVPGPHDWPAYLSEHGIPQRPHRIRIDLVPDARILTLPSAEAVLAFGVEHALRKMWTTPIPPGEAIDWDRVEARWQGIVIAPFQATLRTDPRCRWYFGWDCACACIWDAGAILRTTTIDDATAA